MDWWKQIPQEILGGKGGYTGGGPDGVVQPDRRVPGVGSPNSDKHEGEWVFSADETAAIGPDVLSGMAQAAKSGALNTNAIRAAIGQQAKPGFQAGTYFSRKADELRGSLEEAFKPDPFDSSSQLSPTEADTRTGGPSRTPTSPDPFASPIAPEEADARTTGPSRVPTAPDPFASPITRDEADARTGGPSRAPKKPTTPDPFANPITSEEADARTGGPSRRPVEPITPPPPAADVETGTDYGEVIDEGMDYLVGLMRGDNPYMESQFNQAINQMGGASAASLGAMRQQLVQQGASPQAIATAMASAGAQNAGQMSELMGKLGLEALSQSVSAAQKVISQGDALRRYDDQEATRMATDVQNGITMESFLAKYPDATEADYLAFKTTQEPDLGTSVAVSMLEGGDGFQDIMDNPTFRAYVSNKYGVPEDSPFFDERLEGEIDSILTKNRDTFQTLLDRDVDNYNEIYPGLTVEQLYEDQNVWNNAAYSQGLDPTNPANEERIKGIIDSRYDEVTTPLTERVWNTLVEQGMVPDEYVDDPGTKEATERLISDVYATSFDPETNLPASGAGIVWPWQDSSTFWHFQDWNNNDITYADGESSYNPDAELEVEGNGVEFGILQENGDVVPATFADVEEIWSGLDIDTRDKYFDGNQFDAAAFASDYLRPNGYPGYESINDLAEQWNAYGERGLNGEVETYENEFLGETVNGEIVGGFVSGVTIPKGVKATTTTDAGDVIEVDLGGQTIEPGKFLYYDQKGNATIGDVSSPTFKRIYQQLNRKLGDSYGDGDGVIDAGEFDDLWMGNADKWIVSGDGEIMNWDIGDPGNNYMIDPDTRRENTTQATLDSIGVKSKHFKSTNKVEGGFQFKNEFDKGAYDLNSLRQLRDTDRPSRSYMLNDDVVSWAEDQAGKEVYVEGQGYFIVDETPVAYGQQVYEGTSKSGNFAVLADFVRLVDPVTGDVKLWAPGGLKTAFGYDEADTWHDYSFIDESEVIHVSEHDQPGSELRR